MATSEIVLDRPTATARLGARLARLLRPGDVIGLSGPLGVGKTTLARAVIETLAGEKEAPSPTFTLAETYETPDFLLWHFDLYRLDHPEDVWELGLEEALDGGAVLIEWPERIASLLPSNTLILRLDVDGDRRRAYFVGGERWIDRLAASGLS
jgi:tRNA threonylcarbamoyladenosine biosynthesis protein TsaE